MSPLRVGCVLLAAFTYGSFIWGVFKVFVRKGQPSRKYDLLRLLALAAAFSHTYAVSTSPEVSGLRVLPGVSLYFVSLGLFFWTARTIRLRPLSLAYSPDSPEMLHQDGPYRWIRHPFYTAYGLSYLAGWALSGQHWLWLVNVAMVWLYFDAAKTEEGKFAQSSLRESYERYRQTTGAFFPRLGRPKN